MTLENVVVRAGQVDSYAALVGSTSAQVQIRNCAFVDNGSAAPFTRPILVTANAA